MSAQKRLLRDLKEWYNTKDTVFTISAEPMENNMFEWHANISPIDGPYKDCILHVIMKFTNDYPNKPPSVSVLGGQHLNHPNVFNNGGWICLDMLKPYTTSIPYQGWTPGYSVTAILLQLQSFLFAENIPQSYGSIKRNGSVSKDKLLVPCNTCGHNKDYIWPALNPNRYNRININPINSHSLMKRYRNKNNECIELWDKLYDDVEKYIFKFLSIGNLITMTKVCKRFKYLVLKSNVLQMNKYQCWYHRETLSISNKHNKSSLILGYGINVEFYEAIERKRKEYNCYTNRYELIVTKLPYKRDLNGHRILKHINTSFDLLSYNAFSTFEIRRSLWKDFVFTNFIPIYINNAHGNRALNIFESLVFKQIYQKNDKNKLYFDPMMGINVIISIMNTLIVNLMKTCENGSENVTLHYSINLIETFFHYYHLLLGYYIKHYKNLEKRINDKIGLFLSDSKYRNKDYIPNLGEFKILLTLTNKYKWNNIVKILLEESFTRHSRWILKDYPFLYKLEEKSKFSCVRLNLSFDRSLTSYRLFMFQHFFLNKCCNISSDLSVFDKLKSFNDNLGMAPLDLPVKLQNECKRILKCQNYKEYFNILGLSCPSNVQINSILCNSIRNSSIKDYHTENDISRSIYFKTQKEIPSAFYNACSYAVSRGDSTKCICNFKTSNKLRSNNLGCHYRDNFYGKKSAKIRKGVKFNKVSVAVKPLSQNKTNLRSKNGSNFKRPVRVSLNTRSRQVQPPNRTITEPVMQNTRPVVNNLRPVTPNIPQNIVPNRVFNNSRYNNQITRNYNSTINRQVFPRNPTMQNMPLMMQSNNNNYMMRRHQSPQVPRIMSNSNYRSNNYNMNVNDSITRPIVTNYNSYNYNQPFPVTRPIQNIALNRPNNIMTLPPVPRIIDNSNYRINNSNYRPMVPNLNNYRQTVPVTGTIQNNSRNIQSNDMTRTQQLNQVPLARVFISYNNRNNNSNNYNMNNTTTPSVTSNTSNNNNNGPNNYNVNNTTITPTVTPVSKTNTSNNSDINSNRSNNNTTQRRKRNRRRRKSKIAVNTKINENKQLKNENNKPNITVYKTPIKHRTPTDSSDNLGVVNRQNRPIKSSVFPRNSLQNKTEKI